MTSKAHIIAVAVLVTLLLAGCGGDADPATTTAAVTPPTTTSDATRPATLTPAQKARFQQTTNSFVSSVTTFLAAMNRCVPAKARGRCVRRAADRAERVVTRTRTRVSALASDVGGDCSAQLSDVRGRINEVTDVLSPMAEATIKGQFRNTGRLGTDAQATLRGFAASSLVVDRAC